MNDMKGLWSKLAVAAVLIVAPQWLSAQRLINVPLVWDDVTRVALSENQTVDLTFARGTTGSLEVGKLPAYVNMEVLGKQIEVISATVEVLKFGDPIDLSKLPGAAIITAQESFKYAGKEFRGSTALVYEFVPIAYLNGRLHQILEAQIKINERRQRARPKGANFGTTSVMSQGQWYRIGVAEDGLYQLRKSDLQNLGIDVGNLNLAGLNIYGNGYGQLPYQNSIQRPDDLLANPIEIVGGDDGIFNDEDYILFFARGPHRWELDTASTLFNHIKHQFVDTSYYFIGIDAAAPAKRVTNQSGSGLSPNYEVITFNDYAFHEVDRQNMLESGREWYGEKFDAQTAFSFSGEALTFPNLDPASLTVVRANVLSRTTVAGNCTFTMNVNGTTDSRLLGSTGTSVTSLFGQTNNLRVELLNASPELIVAFNYVKNAPSAAGWLNWFNVNTRRRMRMAGTQMIFRDALSLGAGRVSRFTITNASSVQQVWEVTRGADTRRVDFQRTGDQLSFTLPTENLREFIAFSGGFKSPTLFGAVPNQNLHALGTESDVDMVIVTPARFESQAEILADLHRNFEADPLNVEVVRLQDVYNEFSSGMRDVTAIKWLMKMLYDRAGGNTALQPRYLLLFGDGSYDNRNFTPGNTNVIPTHQSLNSLSPASSYVSDDYFGFLSDDEGESQIDVMDIGVGRIVAKNLQEATSVVNKIRRYMEITPLNLNETCTVCNTSQSNRGPWRNSITLIADDEDNNSHMINSRSISNQINGYTSDYNIERVFTDAFQQVVTPAGTRYPDVNRAIDRRVRNGAFIINYIGHGGELGWAQERILDNAMILAWDNGANLPIFVTATCEFTRFDDPLRTSAGEYALLNGNGGAAALLTTTRLVYSGPNFTLNQKFYDALFNRPADEVVTRLGDVSRDTKNMALSSGSSNHRNFSLIGDPALPLAIPKYRAVVTAITDTLGAVSDTLKALGVSRVRGEIRDQNGNIRSDFNGRVNATVFDRIIQKTTLGNDGGNPFTFPSQESVIYKGNAEVAQGQFQFDFVIPKDIAFSVDTTARISLYAQSEELDATGFQNNLKIGSRDPNAVNDGLGPEIDVFLNDDNFVYGGYTNSTPILVASIFDENGVNTVGSGIGHDITAVIDGKVNETITLNDYYESDLGTYQRGKVQYQFDQLSPGNHSIKVKVWDVHNNSTETEIQFVVAETDEFAIQRVLNYPNPFTTRTEFFFEHNQSCEFLNVLIQIYTVSGKLVKSINTVSNTDGFRNVPIPWDGRDDYGDRLATGVYVYKLAVRNPAGEQVDKFEKLVILN